MTHAIAFREILSLKMIDKQTFLNKGGSEMEGLLKRRELPRVLLITSVKPTISNETVICLSDGISVN